MPAEHVKQVAIIIGPRDGLRHSGKRFRVLSHLPAGERSGVARKQDPVGLRERACGKERIDAESVEAEVAANSREYGPEIDRLIADVNRNHRCRPSKMLLVNRKSLTGEEMHRDGIA